MRGGSLDHHMRWIVVVSAALAARAEGAAQNRTASVECATRLAGAGAAAWARGLSALELRALARTANATCVAGVLPLVDAAGAAALAAGAVDVEVDAAARWARIVGGGGDASGGGARAPTTAAPRLEWAQRADAVLLRVTWAMLGSR